MHYLPMATETKICPHCKFEIPGEATTCGYCGKSTPNTPEVVMRILLVVIITIVGIVALREWQSSEARRSGARMVDEIMRGYR